MLFIYVIYLILLQIGELFNVHIYGVRRFVSTEWVSSMNVALITEQVAHEAMAEKLRDASSTTGCRRF